MLRLPYLGVILSEQSESKNPHLFRAFRNSGAVKKEYGLPHQFANWFAMTEEVRYCAASVDKHVIPRERSDRGNPYPRLPPYGGEGVGCGEIGERAAMTVIKNSRRQVAVG